MTCPECKKGPNYKTEGWFTRHMIVEHNWTTSEAEEGWTSSACYNCGVEIINPIYCISCGVPFKETNR